MALIKCPECGQEISDKSKVCIHCGYPLEGGTEKDIIHVKCPECGREIFDELSQCIHCGYSLKKRNKTSYFFPLLILLVLGLCITIFIYLFDSKLKIPDGYTKEVWNSAKEYVMCMERAANGEDYSFSKTSEDLLLDVAGDTFSTNHKYREKDYTLAEYYMTIETMRLSYKAKIITLEEFESNVDKMKKFMDQ